MRQLSDAPDARVPAPPRPFSFGSLALVFVGGAAGASLRFACDRWLTGITDPDTMFATVLVNLFGSFLVVFVPVLVLRSRRLQLLLIPGLLGGFTTYSTFAAEIAQVWLAGRAGAAVWYGCITVAGGLAAAGLGAWLAGAVVRRRSAHDEPSRVDHGASR